jgi:ABC-type amino acid transport substrate-binding protein
MTKRALAAGAIAAALAAGPAAAQPVSGPHETVENLYTTTQPGAATGFSFTGTYHAAGDPSGDPPYMRRMAFYPPPGFRYDTSVPDRCTASDLELALQGPSACPEGSRLGAGTAQGKFMGQVTTLDVDMFNAENEMVMVARSPLVASVGRGRIQPDGSVVWESPTCYPAVNPPGCPADNVLQMGSAVKQPPYVRNGRSYGTTPPSCPKSGHWDTAVRFWWADGSGETVVAPTPCTRPAAKPAKKKRKKKHPPRRDPAGR